MHTAPQPHLRDVTHPPAEHVHGDLISVLVFPVGRLVPGSLHRGPAVRHHPGHHAAHCVCQLRGMTQLDIKFE